LARKILLADDSVTAQNMGRRILTEAGYEVITVNNGSAALKKIAEAKPDLIVLDVYMPGYGGLEVCQRIREAPETARIPVLLTVGKLEPFKADEARRVRADAYIVKPFEASELLTALTKLEDKIVPQGQPYKPGRFAKAIAAAEESYGLGKEFGNPETGWKDRLAIPPPHAAKHREPEPEAPASRAGFRDFGRSEDYKPSGSASNREHTSPELPQDNPARESIPAAFNAQSADAVPSHLSADLAELPAQERVARAPEAASDPAAVTGTAVTKIGADATFASAQEAQEAASRETSAVTEAEFAVTSEQIAPGEPEISPYVPAEPEAISAATSSDSGANAALPEATQESGDLGDDEVTAALASLAPANGGWDTGANGFATGEEDKAPAWTNEQLLATMAATAGAAPQFSGPWWIAEPVPVTEHESTLILEQEMAKAYAAFAAADPAHQMSGDNRAAEPQTPETSAPEPSPQEPMLAADISTAVQPEITPPSNLWPYSSDSSGARTGQEDALVTAQPLAAVTNEAVTSVPVTNMEECAPPAAELTESAEPAQADAVSDIVSEVEQEAAFAEAAFAAAASASASDATVVSDSSAAPSSSGMIASDTVAPAMIASESALPVPGPGQQHRESDLAAAWANWKQIRESVIGSEPASQVADASAAGFREIRHEPAAPASQESRTEASESSADEATAIASIVDSVLADLKPRLMEEIAKKMGKEPKKK